MSIGWTRGLRKIIEGEREEEGVERFLFNVFSIVFLVNFARVTPWKNF